MSFIPVRVNTLKPNDPLPFEVYLLLEDRYVQYKRVQELIEAEKLGKFNQKRVRKVFIREADETLYIQYLDSALDRLSKKEVKTEAKAAMAQDTMNSEAENIEKNLDSEEGYKATENRIGKVVDFIATEPDALKQMLAQAGISVDNSQHSAAVASLALALASKAGVTDIKEMRAISVAALLHDIGLAKLGFDPSESRSSLKGDRLAKYRKHPEEAVAMVSGKKYITPRVLKLIADHEEIGEGYGYPEKRRIVKLPLSSQVFNLANDFDHYCMENKKQAPEAVEAYVQERGKHFVPEHLEMLKNLLLNT